MIHTHNDTISSAGRDRIAGGQRVRRLKRLMGIPNTGLKNVGETFHTDLDQSAVIDSDRDVMGDAICCQRGTQ
jgi:hypothetical protein